MLDLNLQFAAFPDYTSATDMPEDASLYELEVAPGDIIVAGTDGLWDNVHPEEIVSLLPNDPAAMPQVALLQICQGPFSNACKAGVCLK